MKTTLDLSDDLLLEAKAVAARRRITLRAMVEHALRREIGAASGREGRKSEIFETGPLGILRLKKRGRKVTPALVEKLGEQSDREELEAALKVRKGKAR